MIEIFLPMVLDSVCSDVLVIEPVLRCSTLGLDAQDAGAADVRVALRLLLPAVEQLEPGALGARGGRGRNEGRIALIGGDEAELERVRERDLEAALAGLRQVELEFGLQALPVRGRPRPLPPPGP